MLRQNLLLAAVTALILTLGMTASHAQDKDSPEVLIEGAMAAHAKAEAASGAEKYRLMEDVRELLDRIVDEYPGSDIAVQILLGGEIGEIDIAALDEYLEANRPEPSAAKADPPEAVAIFDSASALFAETVDAAPTRRYRLMRSVRALLDRIVDTYPASELAVQVLLGGKVGPIDIAEVDRVVAEGPEGKTAERAPDPTRKSDNRPVKESEVDARTDPPEDYVPYSRLDDARDAERSLRLTRRERREIQRRLALVGLYTRGIDGVFGRGTRQAIADWQYGAGFPDTGYLDGYQLELLVKETEEAFKDWLSRSRSGARPRRYVDSNGCIREANGRIVPNQSITCDARGAFGL